MLRTLGRQMRPRLARGVSQALAEPMAWNEAPTVVTTLPNGLRVATKETHGETATVGLHVDAGVRNETPQTAGATHILERLAQTGSANRSQVQLNAEVEGLGAAMSFSAGRERTSYSITLGHKDVAQGLDIVADLVKNPALDRLEGLKAEILADINETEQPARDVIDDRLHITAFRDCSLGFSTIGPFDGAEELGKAHLESYLSQAFTPQNMVLAAAGPVKHEELVRLASGSLGGIPKGPSAAFENKPYFCGAELIYRNDEMGPTAYLSVGWEGVPLRSPDAVAFMVMQHIIGSYKKGEGLVPGNISGNRTINAIANKMDVGCADEYEAFNRFYKDTGVFGFYAACDEVAVEHCLGEMMFGINLLSFAVTDEEVARGKRELKRALFGGSGSSAEVCGKVGDQVLSYGRGISAAEMVLRIDAIDAEEIKRVAWQRLNDQEIAVTALGPVHGMTPYMELRRATGMHRY